MTEGVQKRKLIEVALPLEKINAEAVREKEPFTRNHPRSLHIWWARRPLVAARAVLFAQLVDDPSSHPNRFPSEEAQAAERQRLHVLIEKLVVWENTHDEALLNEAREEILKSTGGNPPPILDPFAGGGTIPLEAQRLGLEAHASDLNPVAVLINKALIEIPPKFAGQAPVFPGLAGTRNSWAGAEGLAADVRAYGEWMQDEAEKRIGQHYPTAELPNGNEANVIAWIWARTVTCPNPACGIEMPLVKSWWLGKKKGKEAYVMHQLVADLDHPSGKRVEYRIGHDLSQAPTKEEDGTVDRNGARCVNCGTVTPLSVIRQASRDSGLGSQLMAVVAEGDRRRLYCPPTQDHVTAAYIGRPDSSPDALLPPQAPSFRVQAYGFKRWSDLFTNRQLLALTTFSDLVGEAREKALADALAASLPAGDSLTNGGTEAKAYADAIGTLLGLAVSRYTDMSNSLCSWNQKNENIRALFARQAIPMAWDFAEVSPFGRIAIAGPIESVSSAIRSTPASGKGWAEALPADRADFSMALISTDPPYYDNIGYSDLSDFFYVWLRRSLREIHPDILGTLLVPKAEELVANPYRHDGKDGAKKFFEQGFYEVFAKARTDALNDYPIAVYYAFKQSDSDADGKASTGWETLLDGMIRAGWEITATWPMRSERGSRMLSIGTNALASSIVLALRPRSENAPATDRRGFLSALKAELPDALRKLEQGHIAPVDLPQAAIGPGMAVFSRYGGVIEADGSQMTVRSALARINEILDEVLDEQEGDFDSTTRFAIAWYRQHGYSTGKFGDANNLANARNTSVDSMAKSGILTSAGGNVKLFAPADLPENYDPTADDMISAWEVLGHMIRVLDEDGLGAAAKLLEAATSRPEDPVEQESIKELAFLLFSLAEKNGRAGDALDFNKLATSWPDILEADPTEGQETQPSLDFDTD